MASGCLISSSLRFSFRRSNSSADDGKPAEIGEAASGRANSVLKAGVEKNSAGAEFIVESAMKIAAFF